MKQLRIRVDYKDKEYSESLSKALSLHFPFINTSYDTQTPFDIVIDEETFPLYQPVPSIVNEIMAQFEGPALSLNIPFYGFTAATGGAGLTTSALCFAKIRARLYEKKAAFVSFDPTFRNDFPDNDEYGLTYLKPHELEKMVSDIQGDEGTVYDEIVLDIPFIYMKAAELLDMCEYRIVVAGFDEKRTVKADTLFEMLNSSEKLYSSAPSTLLFTNSYDSAADPSDIHSQLGKEVLDLAKRLEKLKA